MHIQRQAVKLERFKQNRWRFNIGQSVHVYGWNQEHTAEIVKRVEDSLWPAYEIKEWHGETWTCSQLLLSAKRIPNNYEDPPTNS